MILGVKAGPICEERLVNEVSAMRYRWSYLLDVDPAYGPNLDSDGGGFNLAERPRHLPVSSPDIT